MAIELDPELKNLLIALGGGVVAALSQEGMNWRAALGCVSSAALIGYVATPPTLDLLNLSAHYAGAIAALYGLSGRTIALIIIKEGPFEFLQRMKR